MFYHHFKPAYRIYSQSKTWFAAYSSHCYPRLTFAETAQKIYMQHMRYVLEGLTAILARNTKQTAECVFHFEYQKYVTQSH